MSCISSVGRTILDIEELNNLQYELELKLCEVLRQEEKNLEGIPYITKQASNSLPVQNIINIPYLTLKQINDEKIELMRSIVEIEDRIEKEKKANKTSSPSDFSFRRATKTHQTLNAPVRPGMRKPSVHEIDFSPRESNQNDNNNNNNIVKSKTRTELPPLIEIENNEKRKKKEKEKKIDIFSDLKGLSNISGEDIEKIVPNFGPLAKKNISKAIKQEAIMYLNDFLDAKYRSNILAASALKLKGGNVMSTMKGPHHCSLDIQLFGDLFACKSISTYPERVHFHTRDGDPICDRYFVKLFENRIFASLSDGYSWGERSRKAAKKACKASALYIEQRHKDYKTLKDFATGIMEGFADAHRRVLEGVSEAIWESGATTLLNCNLIELDESVDDFKLFLKNGVRAKWALVGGNLGDTKAFLYSHSTQKVIDLTKRTRAGLSSDPGGKLGNYVDGKPDLRNYNLFVRGCEENDLVLLVTDGVYDNYNPVKIGLTPEDFNLNGSWDSLDYAVVSKVISKHIREELAKIIKSRTGSLSDICYKILDDCVKITENQRQFCTENPADRVPNNAKLYPGSLGHATIIVFSVGYVTLDYNKFMGK